MPQDLLDIPKNDTAETRPFPKQVAQAPTTELEPPQGRRVLSPLSGSFGDTTNFVVWIGDTLRLKPALTLAMEPSTGIPWLPNSVADIVAQVIENDLTPNAHARRLPVTAHPFPEVQCIAVARQIAPLIHGIRDLR